MKVGSTDSATNRERGVALILVIMVLTALVVIGTPFAISMKLQEEGSRQITARERARLAQISARNHAVAHLFASHPSREDGTVEIDRSVTGSASNRASEYGEAEVPARMIDDLAEIEVPIEASMAVSPLTSGSIGSTSESIIANRGGNRGRTEGEGSASAATYALQDPKERILDVSVEDEQGKVNVNTALPTLLGNLFAGSHIDQSLDYGTVTDEIQLEDTSPFPADDDPDTIDGVVVIFNPQLFTMEAVSYRGKTDTHLTGCFRGEYLSGTWPAQPGFPVFDLRGMKIFLHRISDLSSGQLKTFRTPASIREIADWSMVPHFAKTMALFGMNVRNMDEYGLTPQMLNRAGLGALLETALVREGEKEVDKEEYREARKALEELGIPSEALDLLEGARGKSGVVSAGEYAKRFELSKREGLQIAAGFEGALKSELKKIKKHTKGYFPKAIEAYKELYDQAGLETITARDFHRIRNLITTTSTRPTDWSEDQQVLGSIENNALLGVPTLPVKHHDWFNAGTIVRIQSRKNPGRVEYNMVAASINLGGRARQRSLIGEGGVILRDPLRYDYDDDDALLSAMIRHPININTAPRQVIQACLTGVRSLGAVMRNGKQRVTAEEARKVTDFLLENMPIAGFEDFRSKMIEAARADLIDDEDLLPVLINALNPNSSYLGISTTGFCYATGDVYTIESTGIVNGPSGLELASMRVREIIEIAPPDDLVLELTSQDDFAFRLFQRATPSMFRPNDGTRNLHDSNQNSTMIPGREGNLMVTFPEVLTLGWEQATPHMNEGSIKGMTAQLEPNVTARPGLPPITFDEVEHFADTIEGHELKDGQGFAKRTRIQSAQNTGDPDAPTAEEDIVTKPGMVEFWIRPRWGARTGDITLFDTLLDPTFPDRNRIQLYLDSAGVEGPELVFRIMDDAQLPPGHIPAGVVSAAEVRHPVTPQTFADDTWYHVTAIWGSTTPGDQQLLIDNRPVGRHPWVSSLVGAFNSRSGAVRVADTEFVERCPSIGALQVGSEVIEYDKKEGNTFFVRQENFRARIPHGRGRRGTARQDHAVGTPVTLFGYTVDAQPSDPEVQVDFPNPLPTNDPALATRLATAANHLLVTVGGAKLDEGLRITQRLNYLFPDSEGVFRPAGDARTSSFARVWAKEFVAPGATAIKVLCPPNLDPITLGFPPSGYLQLSHGSFTFSAGGGGVQYSITFPGAGWEYVKYAQIVPNGTEDGFQVFEFRGLGRGMLGTTSIGAGTLGGTPVTRVYGVSVMTDSSNLSERYPTSGLVSLVNTSFVNRPNGPTDPAAQLPPEAEWIYYRSIAEDRYFIGDANNSNAFRGFLGDLVFDNDLNPGDLQRTAVLSWDEDFVLPHLSGKEIFPVIRTDLPVIGRDDYVWVGASEGPPLQRVYELQPNRVHVVRYMGSGTYASFRDQFQNNYPVRLMPKLKMFPSGSLPIASSGNMTFGAPAAPNVQPGGAGDATIDEIRFSRSRHVDTDFYLFPAQGSGSFTVDPAPEPLDNGVNLATPSVPREVIRRHFNADDEVEGSSPVDKFILLGRGKLHLANNGGTVYRYREEADPRSWGLGKDLGLVQLGSEVLQYTYDLEQQIPQAEILIRQDLPSDLVRFYGERDPETGEWPMYNTNRDLRTEVWPEIQIQVVSGQLPPRGGFIEIYGQSVREVIYYESAAGNRLRNCLRGQLGSSIGSYVYNTFTIGSNGQPQQTQREIRARVLPRREVDIVKRGMLGSRPPRVTNLAGQRALPLTQLGVTRTLGTMTPGSFAVESNVDFPAGLGYVMRDEGLDTSVYEIIGYQYKEGGQNGTLFARAKDEGTGAGLFRGRFGTNDQTELQAGATLIEFPVRYHDRYQPEVESAELQYYQRQFRMPGTIWDGIEWDEEEVRNRTLSTQVRVVVRFDGVPSWDSKPTNRPGGLYQFTDGTRLNKLGVEAELMEFRVYFHYPQGSYGRDANSLGGGWNDSWKHCPAIDSIRFQYRKPWRVIHREDLPY